MASIESVSGTLCCVGKCIMKHAECLLACVRVCVCAVREEGEGRGDRRKCVCVRLSVRASKEGRRGEYDPLVFFWHEMTNIVTPDIFRLGSNK